MTPDHPMLAASAIVFARAEDGVKRTAGLVTERARGHHRLLRESAAALKRALDRAQAWPLDVDAVLAPLRDAYSRLQQASSVLPGFPLVSFEQACCGVNGSSRPRTD